MLLSRHKAKGSTLGAWISNDQLREAIPANSAFVNFVRSAPTHFARKFEPGYWGADHYFAWILPGDKTVPATIVDLGEAAHIETAVANYREAVENGATRYVDTNQGGESPPQLGSEAESLAKLLRRPLTPHLGKPQELLLSPDGRDGLYLG